MTAAAIKQKRYRLRQHFLRSVYRVECHRERVHSALLRSGRLTGPDIWRKDLIETALSRVIEQWVNEVLKHGNHQ
jgi:hypothetical protein